ncbi:MAG: pyruvate dehydrogenase (acetyl-transferring) E1 component subunit alpha [Chloroflexi bacterium]|nr:pyruvate dehydrogenase (acetyl-transferring) E1 component subunit alpha [Chloroflexota bacterium]
MATQEVALDKGLSLELYRTMFLIRRFEERAGEMYAKGKIGGFLHLYIGEEAVAAGVFSTLESQDYIVTHYREHGHALARGIESKRIMAELFGKATGTSKGKGGSMHIFDASKGFLGGYAIVGGMLPVATGLALSAKYKKEDRVTLCIFGDGAVNQGEFWESLNLASLWQLPVLFLLENNGYGMGTSVQRACALREVHKSAEAYGIPAKVADGMDALAMRRAADLAVQHVRSGKGPYFLEAITYRFRGHSMADPMEYRKKTETEKWQEHDPLITLRRQMEEHGVAKEKIERVQQAVEEEMAEAVTFADESPAPQVETMYQDIYAD